MNDIQRPSRLFHVKWIPLVVETTSRHLVWVEDYSDRGPADLARYEADSFDGDLIRHAPVIDGGYDVRPLESWEWHDAYDYGSNAGPWRVCPAPDCARQEYPAYGMDPTCHQHRVTGCQHRRLPEKEYAR